MARRRMWCSKWRAKRWRYVTVFALEDPPTDDTTTSSPALPKRRRRIALGKASLAHAPSLQMHPCILPVDKTAAATGPLTVDEVMILPSGVPRLMSSQTRFSGTQPLSVERSNGEDTLGSGEAGGAVLPTPGRRVAVVICPATMSGQACSSRTQPLSGDMGGAGGMKEGRG